ncbi:MAG: phosphate ABC transporter permease PstA [Actinomycetales bacterium]|nr:phosphate ABC transporter permease PstA [Actinomycetales bacterium]
MGDATNDPRVPEGTVVLTASGAGGPGGPTAGTLDVDPDRLTGRRLPRYAAWVCLAVTVAVGVLVRITGITIIGLADWVVALAASFIGYTAWTLVVEGRRHAVDRLATTAIYAAAAAALVPLFWILITLVVKGFSVLSWDFLTSTMRNVNPRAEGGGVAHAIVGTLEQVAIAAVISVPVGILTAVYLVEYGRGRLAKAISFFVDVMTGIPSIVAGMFIYTFWILTLGFPTSGLAAGLALSILMVPVVIRATEEILKIVPNELREGALALGVPKYKVILRIVLPTAISGIITGVMLAVARVTGETAPLLLTTFLAQDMNGNPFSGNQASLPVFIWDQIQRGTTASLDRAWGGALVLIIIVMIFYAGARVLAAIYAPKKV